MPADDSASAETTGLTDSGAEDREAAPPDRGREPGTRRVLRRVLGGAVVLVTVLAIVFLGGGGWYFAGQIRSDALVVRHAGPQYNLEVVSSGGGGLTLRERPGQEREPALRSASVYGLAWPGGSGVLGPAAPQASPAGPATRPLTVITGTAPGPGTPVQLHQDVYDDPAQVSGARFEQVTYACADGRCPAWQVPGRTGTWAVMVHGKGGTRTEPLRALDAVTRAGMPALVITYRNDQGAPQDPSGYYRYGASEWQDLDNAVSHALDQGAQRVVLFGLSMGGGIVASFLEHRPERADRVAGVVLDAPMLDFRRTVDFGAAQRELPVVGGPIPGPLTWTAETIAGMRYGIDWERIDYLDGNWLRSPALVFHGTADKTVPMTTSDAFAAAYPQLVREVRVPGAGHVESWNVDPGRYTDEVSAFLRRVAGG